MGLVTIVLNVFN